MAVARPDHHPESEGTFLIPSSHDIDRLVVTFDDPHAVADVGLVLPATLAQRLSRTTTATSHELRVDNMSPTPWQGSCLVAPWTLDLVQGPGHARTSC